jgi:hypothetical protein
MSWAESEKLDEWIQRAYENGKREERERIIKNLRVTFALYAGFYPEIGQAILGIIKDVDPVVHEELTKILEEKLNEDR